jgi:hypothetical protein
MGSGMVGSVSSPFASAAHAMTMGQNRMAEAATVLAKDVDPAAIVELELGKAQVKIGAKLARAADEMMGTLIDTLA